MTHDQIAAEFETIVSEDGGWTAGSFEIAPGLWTMPDSPWRTSRAAFALRNACLMLNKRPSELRVLDVGCHEGSMSIPLAQRGCTVVGVEIRRTSLRKAEFVGRAFGLSNLTWIQGDMLQLGSLNLGVFDLVLCFGTLYHVDAPQLVDFVASLNASCSGLGIFDTHISLESRERFQLPNGLELHGRSIIEHPEGSRQQNEKDRRLWASADNDFSYWLTERSLANVIVTGGFGQVFRALVPVPEWPWQDRHWWLAYSATYCADRTTGVGPEEATTLPEPDSRPRECKLLQAPFQKDVRNPSTTPLI